MNTSFPLSILSRRLSLVALVASAFAGSTSAADTAASAPAAAAAPASPLNCELKMMQAKFGAGEAVKLQLELRNTGSQTIKMLVWDSPFERGWQSPYVTVLRGETPVTYRGPTTKRGDPSADDYLTIGAGQSKTAIIDLTPVFDVRRPTSYKVTPQITAHDLVIGDATAVPRPLDKMTRVPLDCPYQTFDIVR